MRLKKKGGDCVVKTLMAGVLLLMMFVVVTACKKENYKVPGLYLIPMTIIMVHSPIF